MNNTKLKLFTIISLLSAMFITQTSQCALRATKFVRMANTKNLFFINNKLLHQVKAENAATKEDLINKVDRLINTVNELKENQIKIEDQSSAFHLLNYIILAGIFFALNSKFNYINNDLNDIKKIINNRKTNEKK